MDLKFNITNFQDLSRQFDRYSITTREANKIIQGGLRDGMKPAKDFIKATLPGLQARPQGIRTNKKGGTRKPLAQSAAPWARKRKNTFPAEFYAGIRFTKGYHLHLADQGTHRSKGLHFLAEAEKRVDPERVVPDAMERFIKFIDKKY